MPGSRIRQPDAALGAKPRAVVGAQRRERQLEHERVAQGRLEIEQVSVQKIPVGILVARLVGEQLGEPDLRRGSEQVQAPRALADQRRPHGSGYQYTLSDPLEPDIQLELGPFRNVDKLDTQTSRGRGRACLRTHGARAKGPGIEHERLLRLRPRRML